LQYDLKAVSLVGAAFFLGDIMEKQQLYRVRVLASDEKGTKSLDVGPAMLKDSAQHFCDTIAGQIRLGKEKLWRDPIIYPIYD
jgi:hypothetical protein